MQATTKAILATNAGRDPERLHRKLRALRSEPFSFFRGTAGLFYATVQMPDALLAAPSVLACGDLHLENFGSYMGDNRLVYFDLSDFDEACLAPLSVELLRFTSSVVVAAKLLHIERKQALALASLFIETYAATLASGKPRWVERATASGPVRMLLRNLRTRKRLDLIAKRTAVKKGKTRLIIDGHHALAASAADHERAGKILTAYARTQADPAHFAPLDIARRIAGNGSLGLERYVVLIRGDGSPDGRYLLDIKVATPSALASHIQTAQPDWRSEAARVVAVQTISQAIPPALLHIVERGKRSYIVKELQPTADRLNLPSLNGKNSKLSAVIQTMAAISAWAHLRGAARFGAASIEALAAFANRRDWQAALLAATVTGAQQTVRQWQDYCADFDSGKIDTGISAS